MITVPLLGIVETLIQYTDGTSERQVDTNMIVQPGRLAAAIVPQDGTDSGARGITDIVFGSGSTAPVMFQSLAAMTQIITKPLLDWSSADFVQTSNMGSLLVMYVGRFELLNAEANGTTIRELGLLEHNTTNTPAKQLFARVTRAPIVKTADMKLTVKWYFCYPVTKQLPDPVVTAFPEYP